MTKTGHLAHIWSLVFLAINPIPDLFRKNTAKQHVSSMWSQSCTVTSVKLSALVQYRVRRRMKMRMVNYANY